MPQVPTPSIFDIPKAEATKLKKLMHEREFLGYHLSYKSLLALVVEIFPDEDDAAEAISKCILGFTDDDIEEVKAELKDKIGNILMDNGISSIRHDDPFGRTMD